jgi:ABC-2 type transport system permease protein
MKRAIALYPAWKEIVRLSMRGVSAYRFSYFASIISLAVQLFMLRALWMAIYDGRDTLNGISADTQIVFISIAVLQRLILQVSIDWTIQRQVTSGQVALNLIRPLGFIPQILAQQAGRTLGYMPSMLAMIPFAMLIGSLRMPDSSNILPYIASMMLAYLVGVLTFLLIGMMAFWIMHVNAIRVMFHLLSDFLGGVLVPLWFMPDALRFVLELLPFQAILFLPAAIYAGEVTGSGLIQPFAVQLGWIVVLWLLVGTVWRRAQRRIVIQGG